MTLKTPDKEKADGVYFRINQDIERGRPETARAQLARLVKLEGRTARVNDLYGVFATLEGDYQRAEGHFREALKEEPEKERFLLNLGNLYMLMQKWPEAKDLFASVAEKSPAYYPAIHNLAMALFHLNEEDKALEAVKRMKKLKPLSPAPNRLEALYYYNKGNYPKALEAADRNISLDPDNPLTFSMMAQIFDKTDQTDDQISALEIASGLAPEDPDIMLDLALAYGNGDRFDSARPLLEKVVKLKPSSGAAHKALSLVCTLYGENELAEKHKKTAMELGEKF